MFYHIKIFYVSQYIKASVNHKREISSFFFLVFFWQSYGHLFSNIKYSAQQCYIL